MKRKIRPLFEFSTLITDCAYGINFCWDTYPQASETETYLTLMFHKWMLNIGITITYKTFTTSATCITVDRGE